MQPKYLGPYRIFDVVGRGGMGAVYEAIHTETHEKAAIKMLLFPFEEDVELRLRFKAEIETLKSMRHPNIVRLMGIGEGEGEEQQMLYYVMEFVDGQSLQQELRKKRFFTWGEVCKIGLELSKALKHAHDRGIFHRDIKPANILLEYNGDVKLSDFGIAHIYGGNRFTHANSVVGTLEFMSPEQAQAGPIGPKTDLYSLGVVLYTLLLGTPPYPAKTLAEVLQRHQGGPPPKISETRPDVPEMFETLIMELLSIAPENRPTNAYLLGRRLEMILRAYLGNPGLVKVRPSEKNARQVAHASSAAPPLLEETSTLILAGASSKEPQKRKPSPSRTGSSPMSLDEFQSDFSLSRPDHSAHQKKTTEKVRRANQYLRNLYFSKRKDAFAVARKNILTESRFCPAGAPEDSLLSEPETPQTENGSPVVRRPTSEQIDPLESLNRAGMTTEKHSRFVPVLEEELDSLDKYENKTSQKAISIQTIFLSTCLLGIGFFIYYLLQPVSADTLYQRILQVTGTPNEEDAPKVSRILRAESNIELFLALYPSDLRAEQMHRYTEEIKLEKLQREFDFRINRLQSTDNLQPLERTCLEAFTLARTQPEKAILRFQAILDLYGAKPESSEEFNPDDDHKGRPRSESRNDLCLELVRRRLAAIQSQLSPQVEDQKDFLRNRLDKAAEINEVLPEQADAIRRGIIEIYQDKPWAAPFVERAKEEVCGQ
ncbi:MAG: serine/threonine protein kinase [Planctomycetaceae bacterium]|nr:serine/threonine protein kinase [Planctomycetaceae bacterium]